MSAPPQQTASEALPSSGRSLLLWSLMALCGSPFAFSLANLSRHRQLGHMRLVGRDSKGGCPPGDIRKDSYSPYCRFIGRSVEILDDVAQPKAVPGEISSFTHTCLSDSARDTIDLQVDAFMSQN